MTNVVKFSNEKRESFYRLLQGQAFIHEGSLYIKTSNETGDATNHVDLTTGDTDWMGGDVEVEAVDLEIIVQ